VPPDQFHVAAVASCAESGQQRERRGVRVVHLADYPRVPPGGEHGERPAEQRPGDPAPPVPGERRDQAEARASAVAPDPDQPGVFRAGPVDRDEVGGGIEERAERLGAELFGIPPPAVGAGNVLPQRVVQQPQPGDIGIGGGKDVEPGRQHGPGQPGHRGIGRDPVVALPPVHGESGLRAGVERVILRVFQRDVEVTAEIAGNRIGQRRVGVGTPGVEVQEPAVIGPEPGAHLACYQVAVQSAPGQRRAHPGYRQRRCHHAL